MIMVILHQVPTERSPNPDFGNIVWCVRDDGGFSGFFESVDYNSYGSPDLGVYGTSYVSCRIIPIGNVNNYHGVGGGYVNDDSYGR